MIVDLIIIAVIVVCVLVGAKRGLVLSLISALSLAIALFVGYLLMPVVGTVINQTSFPKKTEDVVYTYINEALSAEQSQTDYAAALEDSALPEFLKNKIEVILEESEDNAPTEQVSRKAAKSVTDIAVKALAVFIVAVVVFIGLFIVRILWKGVRKLPMIHQLDSLGGVVFGLAEGVLLICAFMLLLGLVSASGSWQGLASHVQDSTVGAFFYGHNFLGKLVALFVK